MSNNTILSTISDKNGKNVRNITIRDYKMMLANANKKVAQKDIAEMIYHRFYGRYIKPFLFEDERYKEDYKHGFAIMASSCLCIEALESFYEGSEETENHGEQVFDSFFAKSSTLRRFKDELKRKRFYKHVRCGILHQGETTGGFTISRNVKGSLYDI